MLKNMLFNSSNTGERYGGTWVATIGTNSYDTPGSVAVAPDGYIYFTGSANGPILVKYDKSGKIIWSKFSDVSSIGLGGIGMDNNGYIYTAGTPGLRLFKFDKSGENLIWQRNLFYDVSGCWSYGSDVSVAGDGSVYVCGGHELPVSLSTANDAMLVKYNSSGTLQWQRRMYYKPYQSQDSSEYATSVAAAHDGSVYVCSSQSLNGVLIKYNSSGTIQWQRFVVKCRPACVIVSSDGYIYTTYTDTDYCTIITKYNSSGTLQWLRRLYNCPGASYGRASITEGPDGFLYVCCSTNVPGILIAKFNSSGTLQWQRTLGIDGKSCGGSGISVSPDGSVYICGYTYGLLNGPDLIISRITNEVISATENDQVMFGNFTIKKSTLTYDAKEPTFADVNLSYTTGSMKTSSDTITFTNGLGGAETHLYT